MHIKSYGKKFANISDLMTGFKATLKVKPRNAKVNMVAFFVKEIFVYRHLFFQLRTPSLKHCLVWPIGFVLEPQSYQMLNRGKRSDCAAGVLSPRKVGRSQNKGLYLSR